MRRLLRIWPGEDWTTKSGRKREVPINDELHELLQRLPRRSPFVFVSSRGTRWACWPQLGFDRARSRAGLSGGPHKLRHTYATEFLARGGQLATLAQLLGHTDEKVTRLYAHLRPEHLAEARNVVAFPSRERRHLSVAGRAVRLFSAVRKRLDGLLAG